MIYRHKMLSDGRVIAIKFVNLHLKASKVMIFLEALKKAAAILTAYDNALLKLYSHPTQINEGKEVVWVYDCK